MNLPLPLFLSAVAVRTVIVLLALLLGIRLFGKRNMGDLDLLDIVFVALLGNAVQNALTYGSGNLGVGLVSAGALLLMDRAIGILFARRPELERRLAGEPTVLAVDGEMDRGAMQREGVSEDEVLTAAREMGLEDQSQIRVAVLEDDGSISIVPKEEGG